MTSFLTVGSVWIAHHSLFTHLRYVDPVLLRLNLLLLLVAAFLPFPTAVMAQAFDASDRAERVAIVFYGGTALVIEVLLRSAIRYAQARPQLHMPGIVHGEPAVMAPTTARGWREAFGTIVYGDRDPDRHLRVPEGRRRGVPPRRAPRRARRRQRGPAHAAAQVPVTRGRGGCDIPHRGSRVLRCRDRIGPTYGRRTAAGGGRPSPPFGRRCLLPTAQHGDPVPVQEPLLVRRRSPALTGRHLAAMRLAVSAEGAAGLTARRAAPALGVSRATAGAPCAVAPPLPPR